MARKPAWLTVLCLGALLLYAACGKREHSNPVDPAFPRRAAEASPTSAASTPTALPASPTPCHTSTRSFTRTNTVAAGSATATPTITCTPTPSATATPAAPVPWLDRGDNTTDICEPPGGCHSPRGCSPTNMGYIESIVDSALYPRAITAASAVVPLTTGGSPCWGPGVMQWNCNCAGTPSGSTCDISNYTADFYSEFACLRLSGSMKGYTWGGYSWQRFNICSSWRPVDIQAYDGIEFYGRSQFGDPNLTVMVAEPRFQFGASYAVDGRCGGTCNYQSVVMLTGSWTQYQVAFAGMDSGWPDNYLISTVGDDNGGDPCFAVGVNLQAAGDGAYDFLVDDLRFY